MTNQTVSFFSLILETSAPMSSQGVQMLAAVRFVELARKAEQKAARK